MTGATEPVAGDEAVQDVVRAFLADGALPPEEAAALADDQDLVAGGVLNSLTLAHLAVFLEERYDFTVEPAEFVADNFRSLERIAAFVERKQP